MIGHLVIALSLSGAISVASAYQHHDALVNFIEYSAMDEKNLEVALASEGSIDSGQQSKPWFLLFSAEWCHWCHEFAEHTLVDADVATYLNQNFINVFIDVDIHNSAYAKYQVTGLPYTVFLNPDGSLYYQYSGTLYGEDFLDVIQEVANEAGVGKHAFGMESHQVSYTPPQSLNLSDLEAMPEAFIQGVLNNFDPLEYGLGKGRKSIQPRTFLYLLENADSTDRAQVALSITKTLERAVERIYDPVTGGFFRYAEKRNWQIPHYEKFADLNAGAILLLYKLNQVSPSPKLKQAADATLAYLTSTLFDADIGTFLSFQIADTDYYSPDYKLRDTTTTPKVVDKVFTDRLAVTLDYLIEVGEYSEDQELQNKVRRSVDFLAEMVMADVGMNRYYAVADGQWLARSGLADHGYVASLFTKAAAHFGDARYSAVAVKVVRAAIAEFYDAEKGIFTEPGSDAHVEYLMELNGLMAQSILELGNRLDPISLAIAESSISHYSRMAEVLEERIWNAAEWEFTEGYVPYLQALEKYFSARLAAAPG